MADSYYGTAYGETYIGAAVAIASPGQDVPSYLVYVRDALLKPVAVLDDFIRLELIPRFNRVGSWLLEVSVPPTPPTESPSDLRNVLIRGHGIIVNRNGVQIFSGPIRQIERTRQGDESRLLVSGDDDLASLAERVALPDPQGNWSPAVNGPEADVRSGIAETVIKAYVAQNAADGVGNAVALRAIPMDVPPSLNRGATVTGRGRYQPLIELVAQLAQAGGGLGFRVVVLDTDRLQFDVYQPQDVSGTARFGDAFGNLQAFRYGLRAARANTYYVGGGGEGAARPVYQSADAVSAANWGRIEGFADRPGVFNEGELIQAGQEELAENSDQAELSISPVDTRLIQYGRDYRLGDMVSLVVDGEVLTDVVREVRIVLAGDEGETVEPVVGTPDARVPAVLGIFDRLASQGRRILNLERR